MVPSPSAEDAIEDATRLPCCATDVVAVIVEQLGAVLAVGTGTGVAADGMGIGRVEPPPPPPPPHAVTASVASTAPVATKVEERARRFKLVVLF